MKNKSIMLIIAIIFVGLGIAGGTYAFLTSSINATNNSYNTATGCFNIDYSIDNGNSTQDITGTLFPSGTASGGLSGRVSFKTNASCNLDGEGTLNLHINSGTSSTFMTSVSSYCENRSTMQPISGISTQADCTEAGGRWRGYGDSYCESNTTLERLTAYTSSSDCTSNGGTWKSGGSPLKYAVYDNSAGTGTPLSKGYIVSSDIGNEKTIYDKFVISSTQKYYYIFIWLDGYLVDNTVNNLPFSGYIDASAIQSDNGYQRVEYIQSSGTQYIDTGFTPNQNTSVELVFDGLVSTGNQDYFGTSTSSNGYSYGFYDGGSKVYDNYNDDKAVYTGHISGLMTVSKQKNVTTVTGTRNLNYTHSSATFTSAHSLYLFARWKTTGAYRPATMKCYSFKIWDNTTLVRNFIPVIRKVDNVVGLYDEVNDVFYTNQATSGEDFTAGPNV